MSCLHIRNLKVAFSTPLGFVKAVDDVSFDHSGGETLALVGETGCGKSVIANSILGLFPENASVEGSIYFKEQDLLKMSERELESIRGKEIGIVFQNPSLALNQLYSVGRQIAESLMVHERVNRKNAFLAVGDVLKRLGFSDIEKHLRSFPFQFSGGMNQRVLIAASMIMNPKVLITDEPTKGLDYELKNTVAEELKTVKELNGSSLLLITHDFSLAEKISDRMVIMYAGEIIEISPVDSFFKRQLHPYSKALFGSLPKNGFHPIPGASPSMVNPPRGCKFHPRCAAKREICSIEKPLMVSVDGREVKCHLYI